MRRSKRIELCAASKQGGRDAQEDDFIVYQSPDKNITVMGVFDGHSSRGGGNKISRALVQGFKLIGKELDSKLFQNPKQFKNFLTMNSEDIDEWLLENQGENAVQAGSTASLGFYDARSNIFYAYNVGDSRIVFFELVPSARQGGKKIVKKGTWHQTADHKPSLQSEIDRIERAGGMVRTGRANSSVARVDGVLAISRSFGDFGLKQPYNDAAGDWVISKPKITGPYRPGKTSDFYAIAGSDGVWDQMTSKEATKRITEYANGSTGGRGSLQKLCNEIVNINIERWKNGSGADNVTAVIMHVKK